jgi:aspartate aminotransferase
VLIDAMAKVQGQSTGGVSPIAQAAAQAALNGPQDSVPEMRAAYAARTARAAALFGKIPGLTCHKPEGAFYLYPGLHGLLGTITPSGKVIDTDLAFCDALLEEAGVALVHGAAFGKSPYMRVSTAASDEAIGQACARIAAFCAALCG